MTDQRLMRLAAEKQAQERANREETSCYVFRRIDFPDVDDVTWYVRTAKEGAPLDSTLEFFATPNREG